MTKTNALAALADRCESATGPDREIDYAIFTALAPVDRGSHWHPTEGNQFTAGIDAAKSVNPDGWHTRLLTEDRHSHSWRCSLRGGYGVNADARAATEPLARLAAALRARAAIADMEADHGR